MNALLDLSRCLDERADTPAFPYRIPSLWLRASKKDSGPVTEVNPYAFFRDTVREILENETPPPNVRKRGGEWTRRATVYNMFVRQTAAWDHDGDGKIGLEDLPGGFRETGTFLKALAILPLLRDVGINTLHLLPITAIGNHGKKGTLGSPYAIRNHFKLDPGLAEPWLGLDAESEFAALVEAAHRLGMRVVLEFVFRTAAKDCDWISDHPDWFYWIDASIHDRSDASNSDGGYGNPRFTNDELQLIHQCVRKNDLSSLPPPPMDYRLMFAKAPEQPEMLDGAYTGTAPDGRRVRIPGAFADWPPDDMQPPWNDVTYLKLYDHPGFNYIAYNTIRAYDSRLAQADYENRSLWYTINDIIPHYQRSFGIDGVMIDMGHALPRRLKQNIVERARRIDRNFAFWEENFSISARSKQEGYNAAVGYLVFDEHIPHKLQEFLHYLASHDLPLPFFATAETHNTPRAASRQGGTLFSRMALAINAFLPAVFYLHQGVELGETFPVNTGLGFSPEQLSQFPSSGLPLFSESALCWDNPHEMTSHVQALLKIREQWISVIEEAGRDTFVIPEISEHRIVGFMRRSPDGLHAIAVLANTDLGSRVTAAINLAAPQAELCDELTGTLLHLREGRLSHEFGPGETIVLPLTEAPSRVKADDAPVATPPPGN